MPNIAIVNYCNLKCKYCFADEMIHEEARTMNLDEFESILEYFSRTHTNHIGIIGGEPTLHPQFKDIIMRVNKYCKEMDGHATLFTNGIELEKYFPEIGDRFGILVNCNSPESQSTENYNKMIETLDHMDALSWFDHKANCGCNVHMGCDDYSYIWDIVDRYHLNHIRTSVVSPGGCYVDWRNKKEEYYNTLKPKFLKFCEDAIKHNCRLNIDCGHIPLCYFNQEELALVMEICDNIYGNEFCHPVIDITPDFKATACFGAYDPVDIRDFENIVELERYLYLKKQYGRAQVNGGGKCSNCPKYKLLQCQGGCLGFAEV